MYRNTLSLFFIFILLFGTITYSQFYERKDFNWSAAEKKISPEEKAALLKVLAKGVYYTESYYSDSTRAYYGEEEFDKYHPVEINGDSLTDIIYVGRNNPGESENITLFINHGSSFYLTWYGYSIIDSLVFDNNRIVKMVTLGLPCCANYIVFKNYYTVKHQFSPISVNCLLDSSEALDYYIKPENIDMNVKFITTADKFLTFDPAPVINTGVPPDYAGSDLYYCFENNQVGLIKRGSEGRILGQTVKRNNLYFFVRINNKETKQSIFEKENVIVYGWIKADRIKLE